MQNMWAWQQFIVVRPWQALLKRLLLMVALISPIHYVYAQPSLSTSANFTSADSARSNSYMDSGGVWNGSNEVTNTTGDTFEFVISNSGLGLPDPFSDDIAFDLSASVTVPAGFRLPVSPFNVTTLASGGAANCIAPGSGTITAIQAGGVGTPITFNLPANTNLPAQGGAASPCSYTFRFGLTTTDSTPFVTSGSYQLTYNFNYNLIDDDVGSQQTGSHNQSVAVRAGDVIVVKTAVPNPADPNGAYADGETAEWTVSVHGNGTGGSFQVLLTDTLNANFNAATLQLTPPVSPPGTPFPVPLGNNQYTINYLQAAQQVNITVRATVAVPSSASSCPDLRNDVTVVDRLGNTSSSFDSVELDLQDPLLDYTPNDITIPFGVTDIVSFNVSNPGLGANGGTAKNISFTVSGLSSLVVSNVSALWSFNGVDTFTYLGLDTIPASGDEVLANGASVLLQFDLGMSTCGGPSGGTLTWTPNYENICGTAFTPPIRSSTFTVINDPFLGLSKTVSPLLTNFGQPASYTVDITGVNVSNLPTTAGVNNDWSVNDTLPPGFINGSIATIPAGTQISVNAGVPVTVGPITGINAGDVLLWEGDRDDLIPSLPSITINFDVDSTPFCPPTPPITITNTATLNYPSCSIVAGDAAAILINDSPIDTAVQQFTLDLSAAPFETGRPDRSGGVANDEANEGEHFTFTGRYDFPSPYGGVWSGSSFTADMGVSTLAGNALELTQGSGAGESSVVIEVLNSLGTTVYGPTNLLFANITGGDGSGVMQVPDFNFIGVALGDANMQGYTLIISYTVTAPEGTLDALSIGLPVGGINDPNKDNNIGLFTERGTISVAGGPASCTGGIDFTQGVTGIELTRAIPTIGATVNGGAVFDVCGPVNASIDIGAPPAGGLSADNIRVLIDGTNYDLALGNTNNITYGGAGNLSALTTNESFVGANNDIEVIVSPDTDNLTGASTINFPVQLNNTAQRNLSGTIFYDSNHTSPDFAGEGTDEDYSTSFSITPAAASANLEVEFFPPNIILGDPSVIIPVNQGLFTWRVRITNVGSSSVSDYIFSNLVPPGYIPDATASTPNADQILGQDMIWQTSSGTLPVLAPGASTEIIVAIRLPQGAGCNIGNPNVTTIRFGCNNGTVLFSENGPNIIFPTIDLQLDHQSTSYCELCRDGTVELLVRNEGASDLYNVQVIESLVGSGLEYVASSSEVFVEGSGAYVAIADHASTTSTSITWDQTVIADLGRLYSDLNNVPSEMLIRFRVRASSAGTDEALLSATRNIQSTATFDLFCGSPGLAPVVDTYQVPLRQPQPQVDKTGRNYSARQTAASYADTVYGGTDDIVVWRIDVANSGAVSSADLEDLLVNDTIVPVAGPPANFSIQHICPTETDANNAAIALETGGAIPAACVAYTSSYDIDDPFGTPGNDEPGANIDATRGSSAYIFYIGTILAFCTNDNNNTNIAWGCEVDAPAGGIDENTSGVAAGVNSDDTALMSTAVNPAGVIISQTVTGTNIAQPVGTKGIVTVTVTNNSGGTIRNLVLDSDVPTDYEIDLSSLNAPNTPLVITPAFGTYPGIVDGYVLGGSNTVPRFTLTSTTSGTPNQVNLLRNGDQAVITFNIIRVRPFDAVNNPEIRFENSGDGSDPDYSYLLPTDDDNAISLNFNDTCVNVFNRANTIDVSINPEDIDININPLDPNLIFILSDPTASLTLNVVVINNGGHDAANYDAYVTIGFGLVPASVPAACTGPVVPPPELGAPPAQVSGILAPEYDPTALTYRCVNNNPLPPGTTDVFTFVVTRRLPAGVSGDLTFRADVLGATSSTDGVTAPPGAAQLGYPYYSKDNIIARIIGFNLYKRLNTDCSENNPSPVSNNLVEIGEECTYQVEANWFGFATPGFGNIEIRNARIYEGSTANNPPSIVTDPPTALDGHGFLDIDTTASTAGVSINTQNPAAPVALNETGFMWLLNTIATTGAAQEAFIADITYRILNDPLNSSAVPNLHDATKVDEVNAQFDVFFTGTSLTIPFDSASTGYPPASLREATVTVTEPNLTITKEVCNLTRNGGPCLSTDFQASPPSAPTVFGDSDDVYVYRLTLENTASGIAQRAPAYDITVIDVLDALDQMTPFSFASDGLDNDGDGLIDGADPDEGSVSDLVAENGVPAQITFSFSNSSALQKINEGSANAVQLFYQTQLTNNVVPTQQLTNTVNGSYDSLTGNTGNQTAPTGSNGTTGGARTFVVAQDQATVEIDNIVINPGSKEFINTSRRSAGLVPGVCGATPCVDEDVVIGEEVMVELKFTVPVSTLSSFTLVDNLPAGLECIEAYDVSLPAFNPPAIDPGFSPGGTFAAIACDANSASWDFGNQQLLGTGTNMQFEISARFVARVQNALSNNINDIIRNGGTSTSVFVTYRDIVGSLVNISIAEARLTVQEPVMTLTKNMGSINPAPPPLVNVLANADAGDVIRVEVVAQNSGTSPVYDNFRILDDLSLVSNLTFIGNVGGTHIPDVIDTTTLGANRPIFSYNSSNLIYPIDPGEIIRFSFDVLVSGTVQPLEVLDNTLSSAWTSLPNNSVSLNSTTLIGIDGAANGMRIGAIPNVGDPINDYESQVTSALLVPSLAITKTDLDLTVVPTIGARKQYEILITLPEGNSNNVIVNDNLASGDTSLLLENDATYDISYQCTDISTINGVAVGDCSDTTQLETALLTAVPADEASGVISWNFGSVLTFSEDDIPGTGIRDPTIRITYFARVANDVTTFDGQQAGNSGELNFRNGEDSSTVTLVDNTALVTVIEPDLQVTKNYIDLPAPIPPGAVTQGQPAVFDIIVDNVGNSTAWDITIEDMLPNLTDSIPPRVDGGMCDNAPTILNIDAGGRVLVAGNDYTTVFTPPASPSDLHCSFVIMLTPTDLAAPANNARLDAGETLTIRYQTTPDIGTPDSVSLTNIAGATEWFSLDTDGLVVPAEIRRYTRILTLPPDANPGTVGINDYQDAETVLTQSPIISATKSVENITTGQNPALTVSPGDSLRYTIVINNTGSVAANNIQVIDDVDALNIINYADGYFENSPLGTLRNVTISTSATDNSQQSGGVIGSGLLDLTGITVPATGSVTITFDIDVEDINTPLPKAYIENQASIVLAGFNTILSNITQVEIVDIEAGFVIQKTSQDTTGDPNLLELGDTLLYTITVKNTGSSDPNIGITHAINSILIDQIPANTSYVANSTRLNGVAVSDSGGGISPLSSGLSINSPDVTVPGFLTANPDPVDSSNVATVMFEVTVNSGLINGTIISNQALLNGQQQAVNPFTPIPFTPTVSDDPNTPNIPDDPTQDVIGSGVNIDVLKTVSVVSGVDTVANTGETLRYTLIVSNKGNAAATGTSIIDSLPNGTSFISGTLSLNGTPVPDSGTLPLISGVDISSSDLTPPIPGTGLGIISAGESATIQFDVSITAGNGTVISNQATVSLNEQPDEPSDADGNDENGDQATVIIVGNFADLEIIKEVIVVDGGVATAGGQLEYLIRVDNVGSADATNTVITDSIPLGTTYVLGSGELNGETATVVFASNSLTATVGNLSPNRSAYLRFRVTIDQPNPADYRLGEAVENTALVTADTGISETDSANIDIGGAPGVVNINGFVWHNLVHDAVFDSQTEPPLQNWIIRVYVNNSNPSASDTPLAETQSNINGVYMFNGLAPVDSLSLQGAYTVTFSVPSDAATYPPGSNIGLGQTLSTVGQTGLMRINNIVASGGRNVQNENLPVDPTGIVYNSVTRAAVQGARVSLLDANGDLLPQGCFTTPAHLSSQQGQISSENGFYRFDLNFSRPECPASVTNYTVSIETLIDSSQYIRNVSAVITPELGPLVVSNCPDTTADRVPSPPVNTCEIQEQALAPDAFIPPGSGTLYFLDLALQQGPDTLFNNHIPVDLDTGFLVAITKQTPLKNVVKGQLVPYTITVNNQQDFAISALEVRDYFPAGFKYVEGSASIEGVQVEPQADVATFFDDTLNAGTLTWRGLFVNPQDELSIKFLLIVGSGVGEGEYVNRAQAFVTGLSNPISQQASATVRVVPDPTFDCSDVIGKVFDDKNMNGYQDLGEPGIAGARVVTARGLLVTTDQYGRFHIVCAMVPNPDRGSNFIIKLDERSLPTGYRVMTENPRVERLTRGKMVKFNFAVSLHRIVRLDIADAAFKQNSIEIRDYWLASYEQLFEELQQGPSILRLSYLGDAESESLAKARLAAIRQSIENRWHTIDCCYDLLIETEIFWRRGKTIQKENKR